MITDFSQRWSDRRAHYRIAGIRGETFNPRFYEVAEIEERDARAFVCKNHYSGSFPSALISFGLFRGETLCGTFVSSVPQGKRVLSKVFPDSEGMPTDCGRFVLADEVELNGESWFHARCRELLTRMGFTGLLAFADDVRRTNVEGEIVFGGHLGIVYRSSNALFLGRATARRIQLLPDGRVLGERAIQKIRKGEKGWRGAAARLEALGAPPVPEDPCERLTWLHAALASHTRPLRHPGPLHYAWRLHPRVTVLGTPQRYPRLKYDDVQPLLFAA
jgi:hypothetical protein